MTEQEKQLLIKDLCARLPYGVKCDINGEQCEVVWINPDRMWVYLRKENGHGGRYSIARGDSPKPYLRLMSNMTEDERNEMKKMLCPTGTGSFDEECLIIPMSHFGDKIHYDFMSRILEWLNARYFDHRGLIEMGLAFEAPEGMYKIKTK